MTLYSFIFMLFLIVHFGLEVYLAIKNTKSRMNHLFESAVDIALIICVLLQFNVDVCSTIWLLIGVFASFVDIDSLLNRKQIKDN
jgi:hypothetical protein